MSVCVASAGDQNPAIGERGGGVTRAWSGEIIDWLNLFRTGGAHPRGDRQHDDRAEQREKVAKDVVSFGCSLHVRGAFGVEGVWGELLGVGVRGIIETGLASAAAEVLQPLLTRPASHRDALQNCK